MTRTCWAGILVLGVLGPAMLAQHALDANLRVGSAGRNTSSASRTVSQPLYTVNRQSGEFMYNRANAFNDPTYNIYQRYHSDRFTYFNPTGGARTGQPGVLKPMSPRPVMGRSASSLSQPAYSVGRLNPMAGARSPGVFATRRVQPQALTARRYSPIRVGAPYPGTTARRTR